MRTILSTASKALLIAVLTVFNLASISAQIDVQTNFEPAVAAPLDNRTVIETLGDTSTIAFPYEGLIVFVKDIDAQWLYGGVVWTVLPSGGGGGGDVTTIQLGDSTTAVRNYAAQEALEANEYDNSNTGLAATTTQAAIDLITISLQEKTELNLVPFYFQGAPYTRTTLTPSISAANADANRSNYSGTLGDSFIVLDVNYYPIAQTPYAVSVSYGAGPTFRHKSLLV
jgi:hypothetical protein